MSRWQAKVRARTQRNGSEGRRKRGNGRRSRSERMRKRSAKPITTNMMTIAIVAELSVYFLRTGIREAATTKLRNMPPEFIRPQLIDSVTPSSTVYSTASSYATKNVGSVEKPRIEVEAMRNVSLS